MLRVSEDSVLNQLDGPRENDACRESEGPLAQTPDKARNKSMILHHKYIHSHYSRKKNDPK